jgi:hypothetical protein
LRELDLTDGTDGGVDPLHVYYVFNLNTKSWYEVYGGDTESDGLTSGLYDGMSGLDVTLWYWLST